MSTAILQLDKSPADSATARPETEFYTLKNNQLQSPRTINLTAAAIVFFHREVFESEAAVEMLPRMRPGKIIEGVNNDKHRQIQVVPGHSSIKTTQIYRRVSRDEIAKIRSPSAALCPKK